MNLLSKLFKPYNKVHYDFWQSQCNIENNKRGKAWTFGKYPIPSGERKCDSERCYGIVIGISHIDTWRKQRFIPYINEEY